MTCWTAYNQSKESEREAAQGNDSNFNPLIPESDKHLISPYNITPESNIKVMRIKEMTTNWRTSWLLNKFS